ncbi:hypothetical protein EI94DRAFT_1741801, partial [Lactarius quietus]
MGAITAFNLIMSFLLHRRVSQDPTILPSLPASSHTSPHFPPLTEHLTQSLFFYLKHQCITNHDRSLSCPAPLSSKLRCSLCPAIFARPRPASSTSHRRPL